MPAKYNRDGSISREQTLLAKFFTDLLPENKQVAEGTPIELGVPSILSGGAGKLAKGAWKGGSALLNLMVKLGGADFIDSMQSQVSGYSGRRGLIRAYDWMTGGNHLEDPVEVAQGIRQKQEDVVGSYEAREESKLLSKRAFARRLPRGEDFLTASSWLNSPLSDAAFRPDPRDNLLHYVASNLGLKAEQLEEHTRPIPTSAKDLLGIEAD